MLQLRREISTGRYVLCNQVTGQLLPDMRKKKVQPRRFRTQLGAVFYAWRITRGLNKSIKHLSS
jgi:hypothetical protein